MTALAVLTQEHSYPDTETFQYTGPGPSALERESEGPGSLVPGPAASGLGEGPGLKRALKKAALNGTVLAWEESGTGPAVLLVHGLSETHASWRYQRDLFSQQFRVIACDVRGFGESETGEAAPRPEQYAHDLRALLIHLGVERAAIVGFSMGGVIAQCFAIHHPEMTRALVIAASSSVVNRQAAEYYLERAKLAETQGLEAVRAAAVSDAAACFVASSPEVLEAYRQLRRGAISDARG